MNSNAERKATDLFYATLSKLYPLEFYSSVTRPEGRDQDTVIPRFCWKFYRPGIDGFKRLKEAIDSYKGNVRWFLRGGSGGTICIAAHDDSPQPEKQDNVALTSANATPSDKFIEKALVDAPNLWKYLEETMQLQSVQPKEFVYDFREPPSESETVDFLDPGYTDSVWIVSDPKGFATVPHEESSDAMLLHFGLNFEELAAITSMIRTGTNYPLLSRFLQKAPPDYGAGEVEDLRQECVLARGATTQKEAIFGLDKLILMTNWGKKLGRGLYFSEQ